MASKRAVAIAARRFASSGSLPCLAQRTSSHGSTFASSVRPFAIGVSAANPLTPGFKPHTGTKMDRDIELHKAKTWDEGVATEFKPATSKELFGGKNVVLFAVPGAFTGVCHLAHVPSYAKLVDQFKAKGVDNIYCVSVNDPYTMNAWQEKLGDNAKGIEFYADVNRMLTKFMHMEKDLRAAGLAPGMRSNRYSLYIKNGVIDQIFEEDAPSDLKVSDGETMLKAIS